MYCTSVYCTIQYKYNTAQYSIQYIDKIQNLGGQERLEKDFNFPFIYIYKTKNVFKAYIKKWVKPRNTLY